MADLISQSNILKGLSDEQLQQEMAKPNGETPPFLVASEVSRRQTMRQSYDGERMRRGLNPTTVAEDLMKNSPLAARAAGGGLDAAGGAPPPDSPPAAPSTMPTDGAIPKFASGGIVDYTSMEDRYQQQLAGAEKQRKQAEALALMAGGAGMLEAKTSNFGTALGAGIDAGVSSYTTGLTNANTSERETLRDLGDVVRYQHADELAALERARQDQRSAVDDKHWTAEQARLTASDVPPAVRTYDYYKSLPEKEKGVFTSVTGVDPLAPRMDAIYQNTLRELASTAAKDPTSAFLDPAAQAARDADMQKHAQVLTYQRIKASYGPDAAMRYAAGAGLTDADIAGGGVAGTPVDPAANAGTGSGATRSYTDYFN